MYALNCQIPLAALHGFHKTAKKLNIQPAHFVHLSTVAAAGLSAEYGATKKAMEEHLETSNIDATILRLGYVIKPWIKDSIDFYYKNFHQLSIEEMALLPLALLLGEPKSANSVILSVIAIEDLVKGIFNLAHSPPKKQKIDATNGDLLTQEEFFKFFTDLYGKPFRPLYIPTYAAMALAKHHEFGHLTPYTIEYCEKKGIIQDGSAFKKLVGDKVKKLNEIYALKPSQSLIIPRPPLTSLAWHIAKNLWKKPESRNATASAMIAISQL